MKKPADCKDFVSSTQNNLPLIRNLSTNVSKYAQVRKGCEIYVCGGFDDPTKCFKLQRS